MAHPRSDCALLRDTRNACFAAASFLSLGAAQGRDLRKTAAIGALWACPQWLA